MFNVDETTAEVLRQVFEESGRELEAAIELRWHFPWITDYAAARRLRDADCELEAVVSPTPRRTRTCRT
jgi:hypothetical protein